MSDDAYRTFWRRLGAGLADQTLFVPLSFLDEWGLSLELVARSIAIYLVASSSIFLLYSILMHGLFGQTVGKMLTRVRVVDLAETGITMRQAILRDSPGLLFQLAFLPTALTHLDWWIAFQRGDVGEIPRWFLILGFGVLLMFLVEFATMLTNRKRRALHDFIAGTIVDKLYNQPMERTS